MVGPLPCPSGLYRLEEPLSTRSEIEYVVHVVYEVYEAGILKE